MSEPVIITAALNGNREGREHPFLPITPAAIAAEAARCRDAGASIIHLHARTDDGGWTADLDDWRAVMIQVRRAVPDGLISITSLRPDGVPVAAVLQLLAGLAADPSTSPDLISLNLGHITVWEHPVGGGAGRATRHFPNSYDDIRRLLAACAEVGVQPELAVMDLGFVSNAVALRDNGLLPAHPWFLVELDSPAYGAGGQVAPSTVATYEALAQPLRAHFPEAPHCAHGSGVAGYTVLERALVEGAHIRVGFEDAVQLPDGSASASNADLVTWAVRAAAAHGRRPASVAETRRLLAGGDAWLSTEGGQ